MTVGEIITNVTHSKVQLRSIRNGKIAKFDTVPKKLESQWTPGFVVRSGVLTIDVDRTE